jgi:hypothetical protein
LECLQAHHATVLAALISTWSGENSLPLCDPSQNGCVAERPHAHHQKVPASVICTMGPFWKTTGSLMPLVLAATSALGNRKLARPVIAFIGSRTPVDKEMFRILNKIGEMGHLRIGISV